MLAAAGIGRFSGIAEASDAWYRLARLNEPDRDRHETYREIYARYLNLMQRLCGDVPLETINLETINDDRLS
jgi:sugar (pentulose or hexulose) kinase